MKLSCAKHVGISMSHTHTYTQIPIELNFEGKNTIRTVISIFKNHFSLANSLRNLEFCYLCLPLSPFRFEYVRFFSSSFFAITCSFDLSNHFISSLCHHTLEHSGRMFPSLDVISIRTVWQLACCRMIKTVHHIH